MIEHKTLYGRQYPCPSYGELGRVNCRVVILMAADDYLRHMICGDTFVSALQYGAGTKVHPLEQGMWCGMPIFVREFFDDE